jgi:hypothetical protein
MITPRKNNSLLPTNNLSRTVNCATGTENGSSTIIGTSVDITRLSWPSTCLVMNSLSDHDSQFLTVNNIVPATNIVPLKQRTREINNESCNFNFY